MARLKAQLLADGGLDGEVKALGLSYCRAAERATRKADLVEVGHAAALVVAMIRMAERLPSLREAQRTADILMNRMRWVEGEDEGTAAAISSGRRGR